MRKLTDIDWATWTPVDRATLLFIIEPSRVLLIEKKRGLGAGKVNGPGGRIETGEQPIDAAIREVQEELGITPMGIRAYGLLDFQFIDGYSVQCHVFRADRHQGTPVETEEAKPLWTPLDAIPFGRMWADDALWFPMLLDRQPFAGRFLFDGDRMLDHDLGPRT